jgi:succinyl-CoA synthetase beta subunit
MAREKRGKQRFSSPEIESPPSSDSEATKEASHVAHHTGKRKTVAKAPLHSRGHGRPNPQGTSTHGAHPHTKRTSALRTHMSNAEESIEYLERIILRMQPPIRQTAPQYNRTHLVDCTKGKHDLYTLR